MLNIQYLLPGNHSGPLSSKESYFSSSAIHSMGSFACSQLPLFLMVTPWYWQLHNSGVSPATGLLSPAISSETQSQSIKPQLLSMIPSILAGLYFPLISSGPVQPGRLLHIIKISYPHSAQMWPHLDHSFQALTLTKHFPKFLPQ